MIKEFTTSCYILKDESTLLLFHQKLQKWLPPGGHIEENETPTEAVKREVMEETGFEIEFIRNENLWINAWNANSFERPYFCLLEEIPAHKQTPKHQHIDFVYVAKPISQVDDFIFETQMQWMSLETIMNLKEDEEIFGETQKVLQHLLKSPALL